MPAVTTIAALCAPPRTVRQYVLVEVHAKVPVSDLADKVAGRAWSLGEDARGLLLDSGEAYRLAQAQMEAGRG